VLDKIGQVLLVLATAVLFVIGLSVVGASPNHDWKSGLPWFIAAGLVGLAALTFLFGPAIWRVMSNRSKRVAAPTTTAQVRRSDVVAVDSNARDVDRTPEELWAIFTGLTDLQAHQVVDVVIGQPMTISGDVRSVGAFTTSSQVTLARPEYRTIYLYFDDRAWISRLAMLKAGDHIRVRGRIRRITSVDLDLDLCGFVDDPLLTLGA
jgi:hypothetical protein